MSGNPHPSGNASLMVSQTTPSRYIIIILQQPEFEMHMHLKLNHRFMSSHKVPSLCWYVQQEILIATTREVGHILGAREGASNVLSRLQSSQLNELIPCISEGLGKQGSCFRVTRRGDDGRLLVLLCLQRNNRAGTRNHNSLMISPPPPHTHTHKLT